MDVYSQIMDGTGFTTNEKKVDMYPVLFKNYSELTPLTVILAKLREEMAKNTRVDWIEDEELPTEFKHTGYLGATGTTGVHLYVDYPAALKKEDLLLVPSTGEIVSVETNPADTDLYVRITRAQCGTTIGIIPAGEILVLLSMSKTEAADEVNARSVVNSAYYNYTQIINEFTQVSKSVNAEETWFGPKRIEGQKKMWRAFQLKLERTLYFGQRYLGTNRRFMGGLMWRLNNGTNCYNVDGLLTETGFDDYLDDVYQAQPDNSALTLFGSPTMINKISQMFRNKIRISPEATKYGLNIKRYEGAVDVDLVKCPLLTGPTMKGYGFLLNLNKIAIKWLRKPKMLFNTYVERAEYIEDKVEAEITMIIGLEKTHGLIKGMRG